MPHAVAESQREGAYGQVAFALWTCLIRTGQLLMHDIMTITTVPLESDKCYWSPARVS
jgi:hypothetical protein